MVALVLFGAAALPHPDAPPLAHVAKHEYDPWNPGSTFQLRNELVSKEKQAMQNAFARRVGQVVLGMLGLFILYGLLRAASAGAFALARRRDILPGFLARFFVHLDRGLQRLSNLPRLPQWRKQVRVRPEVASCSIYRNPLSDPRAASMGINGQVEYAYAALCALALDLGHPKEPGQTPYEFLDQFPQALDRLREEATDLTHLLVQSIYAGVRLDEKAADRLRRFWLSYERVRNRIVR